MPLTSFSHCVHVDVWLAPCALSDEKARQLSIVSPRAFSAKKSDDAVSMRDVRARRLVSPRPAHAQRTR
eukprot:scaffold80548_cov63-Phaeocystis_antarctica.AAC.4